MTLGEKITFLRKKNSLSQPDLALKVGVTRDTIGKYERNDILPTVEKAKRMADAFGVTIDFLMSADLEEPKNVIDKEMSSRIQELYSLTENDRDKILSIVDAFIRDTKTKNAYRSV